jgi:TusA-related sulfurtransferase
VTAARPPLDLRPYACPLTYVKARIALERISGGERLALLLAAGEPAESVPRSAEEEGHRVVSVEPFGEGSEAYLVVIEKRSGAPEVPP